MSATQVSKPTLGNSNRNIVYSVYELFSERNKDNTLFIKYNSLDKVSCMIWEGEYIEDLITYFDLKYQLRNDIKYAGLSMDIIDNEVKKLMGDKILKTTKIYFGYPYYISIYINNYKDITIYRSVLPRLMTTDGEFDSIVEKDFKKEFIELDIHNSIVIMNKIILMQYANYATLINKIREEKSYKSIYHNKYINKDFVSSLYAHVLNILRFIPTYETLYGASNELFTKPLVNPLTLIPNAVPVPTPEQFPGTAPITGFPSVSIPSYIPKN